MKLFKYQEKLIKEIKRKFIIECLKRQNIRVLNYKQYIDMWKMDAPELVDCEKCGKERMCRERWEDNSVCYECHKSSWKVNEFHISYDPSETDWVSAHTALEELQKDIVVWVNKYTYPIGIGQHWRTPYGYYFDEAEAVEAAMAENKRQLKIHPDNYRQYKSFPEKLKMTLFLTQISNASQYEVDDFTVECAVNSYMKYTSINQ